MKQVTKEKTKESADMSERNPIRSIPRALEPPVNLDSDSNQLGIWSGSTTLSCKDISITGVGRVFLDLLPLPEFRFDFVPDEKPALKDIFFACSNSPWMMECGTALGTLECQLTQSGRHFTGHIEQQVFSNDPEAVYKCIRFVVLNGPSVDGAPVARDSTAFLGRMVANVKNAKITIDRLNHAKQERRKLFEATHVIECVFDEARSISDVDQLRDSLFWTLSLMKCRWVGVVGPWLDQGGSNGINFRVSVTKTMRNGGGISWCHDTMHKSFEELAPVLATSFEESRVGEALKTALHWLIESNQCAGGVEGAIVLQQAALECLAWLEIVVKRKLHSKIKFKKIHAAEKIRKLLSLSNISFEIPEKSVLIKSYAAEHKLDDLVDVLVSVRNSLVHAEPNKVVRLFSRNQGSEERGDIWYQAGGILQQAVLASIGYRGDLMRRDVDARYAVQSITPAPWAS